MPMALEMPMVNRQCVCNCIFLICRADARVRLLGVRGHVARVGHVSLGLVTPPPAESAESTFAGTAASDMSESSELTPLFAAVRSCVSRESPTASQGHRISTLHLQCVRALGSSRVTDAGVSSALLERVRDPKAGRGNRGAQIVWMRHTCTYESVRDVCGVHLRANRY